MSMNLSFKVKGGGYVDFPYQTRTTVSYAVLAATTVEEKLQILREDLSQSDNEEWQQDTLRAIEALLTNPNLKLIVT